jgi:hypothetical protein
MRGPLHRVAGLEARRAEADQARKELTLRIYEEIGATYSAMFERVLSSGELTAEQEDQMRARLVEELKALAPDSETA